MDNVTVEQYDRAVETNKVAHGFTESIDASNIDPMDNPAVNQAAEVFSNSLPRIKALAKNLKGGSLYRVFAATMEFPLQDKEPKFLSKAENELFILCLSATMAKSTMLQAIAAEQARIRKTEDQLTIPKEESNGESNMDKAGNSSQSEGLVEG